MFKWVSGISSGDPVVSGRSRRSEGASKRSGRYEDFEVLSKEFQDVLNGFIEVAGTFQRISEALWIGSSWFSAFSGALQNYYCGTSEGSWVC